ncbi:hypothetical protein QYF36_010020 [Acer negundo]|nr:hypothetical protein QYF36_010020 [Acer negundo]
MKSLDILRNRKSEGRSPQKFYGTGNQRDEVLKSSTELKIRGTKSSEVLRNWKSEGRSPRKFSELEIRGTKSLEDMRNQLKYLNKESKGLSPRKHHRSESIVEAEVSQKRKRDRTEESEGINPHKRHKSGSAQNRRIRGAGSLKASQN